MIINGRIEPIIRPRLLHPTIVSANPPSASNPFFPLPIPQKHTMRTLPLDKIVIPGNRQRTDFPDDHIAELLDSIFSETGAGLLNAVTIRDGNTLVAGECRMRAVTLGYSMGKVLWYAGERVPDGHIPVVDFGDLDELAQMEAEYAENAVRRDIPWQDNIKSQAALHALRSKQKAAQGETQTFAATAKEVFKDSGGSYSNAISTAVRLAANLGDRDIAKATSLKEAKKILAKKEDAQHRERLAAIVGKTVVSDRMRVFNANCLDWMKEQQDGQYDVILTDPPYGMDADDFGDGAGRLTNAGHGHHYRDDKDGTMVLLATCIPEFYRLSKPQAHLYLWCDLDLFHWLREQCRAAGYRVFRTPLINVKPEGGRVPWPEWGPRRSYEICLYAVKGDKAVNAIVPDVFESRLVEGNFGHGAQKPVEAYVNLLKRSVKPGDRVFDAFAGTGTIFPAAAAVNCYADGVEMESAAYGTCVKRIQELS